MLLVGRLVGREVVEVLDEAMDIILEVADHDSCLGVRQQSLEMSAVAEIDRDGS